jgi:hypothetical protein
LVPVAFSKVQLPTDDRQRLTLIAKPDDWLKGAAMFLTKQAARSLNAE